MADPVWYSVIITGNTEDKMERDPRELSTEEFIRRLIAGHCRIVQATDANIQHLMDIPIADDSLEVFATIFEELLKRRNFAQRAAESLERELTN